MAVLLDQTLPGGTTRGGEKSYVAAGSVVTSNVPNNALVFGRSKQKTKKNWNKK